MIDMKKILLLAAVAIMIATSTQAQNQPTGMRVEVAEAETDHGDYSIFTYKEIANSVRSVINKKQKN